MNLRKISVFACLLLPLCFATHAQSFVDNALLFSRNQLGGSARIQGIGGAQVSLGGDYSSARSNPAGLGMFNRSEITFSFGLHDIQTSTEYAGNDAQNGRSTINLPGFSYVQKQQDTRGKYLGGSIAFAFHRTNNFSSQYNYQGDNSQSSLIDYFIQEAQGETPNSLLNTSFYSLAGLAYGSYLIQDYVDVNNQLFWSSELYPVDGNNQTDFPTVRQSESVLRKGAQNQLSLSYGGNYDDKFFFGLGVGVATIRFTQDQSFQESNFRYSISPPFLPLNKYSLDENFDIQGSGVNFTLGAIYRPIDFIQIGFSVATPTFYSLTDAYVARIDSRWYNFDYFGDGSEILNDEFAEFDVPLISEYDLKTPTRANLGLSLLSKFGFISADLEFINYTKTTYTSDIQGFNYDFENTEIRNLYTNTINYRVGAEFRYEKLRLRGGYNRLSDPFLNSKDRSIETLSAGIGARFSSMYIDFAYITSFENAQRTPYRVENLPTPRASLRNVTQNYMFTIGFPF